MNYRILVIDSDHSQYKKFEDYFSMNDFKIEYVNDGESGLKKCWREDYDLVFLDIDLPHMDGYEVCRRLREKCVIPVIYVTEKSQEIDMIRSYSCGASDYILKPFSPALLVAKAKAHINNFESIKNRYDKSGEVKTIRGMSINTRTRRVFVDGIEIRLAVKEYELLLYLANHPGIVFKRDDLYKQIWNMDSVGGMETVTVHVRKLRDKIEKNNRSPEYIETVWGRGYRFKA